MVIDILGQKVIGIVIFCLCGVAEPGLELADDVGREVRPVRRGHRLVLDVLGQVLLPAAGVGRLEVAGVQVVEGGDVGRSLDGGVAAQGDDAAARPADVAEQ